MTHITLDDRVLAHLQVVFAEKLRCNESFFLSWFDSQAVGNGRSSAWIAPEVPIMFRFSSVEVPRLNLRWVEAMMLAAGSAAGLVLGREPNAGEPPSSEDNSAK